MFGFLVSLYRKTSTFVFQQKKAFFLTALVLVSVGMLFPQTAHAAAGFFAELRDAVLYAPIRMLAVLVVMFIAIPAIVATFVFKMLASLSYGVFAYVLSQMIRDPQNLWTITTNPVFLSSWNIVKNWANMVIVLGLIAIATATILHIREEYRAKKLLVPLIVVALLVNFSIVFVGVIIDGSNLVMRQFVVSGEQEDTLVVTINAAHNNIADPLYTQALGLARTANDWATPIGVAVTYAATEYMFAFMYLVVAVILFLLTLVFIQRYVMLAILFILSPLAFVFYIFPISRKFTSDWWQLFISWSFAGVIAAFFLQLSVRMLSTFNFTNLGSNQGDQMLSVMPRVIMQLGVALGFLFAGYKFSRKSSVIASKVLDMTRLTPEKIGGAAAALGLKTGKWTADNTGLTRAKNAIQYGLTRTLEALPIPVLSRGTAAANWKRQEEAKLNDKGLQEKINAMSGAERAKVMNSQDVFFNTTKGKEQRDATFRAMQKDGQTGLLSKEARLYAMQNLARRENSTSVFSKDPDFAHLDTDKIKELKIKNPGKSDAELQNMARAESYARMPVDKDLLKLSDGEKVSRIIASAGGFNSATGKLRGEVDAGSAQLIEDLAEKGNLGKLAKALKDLGASGDGIEEAARQMDHMVDGLGSSVYKDAKQKDLRFVEHDKKAVNERGQEIATKAGVPFNAAIHLPQARQELTDEAHGKISAYQIADSLPEESITKSFVTNKNITHKKLSAAIANDRMSENKKLKLKALLPDIQAAEIAARGAGNITLADDLEDRWLEIDAMII